MELSISKDPLVSPSAISLQLSTEILREIRFGVILGVFVKFPWKSSSTLFKSLFWNSKAEGFAY